MQYSFVNLGKKKEFLGVMLSKSCVTKVNYGQLSEKLCGSCDVVLCPVLAGVRGNNQAACLVLRAPVVGAMMMDNRDMKNTHAHLLLVDDTRTHEHLLVDDTRTHMNIC